MNSNIEKLKKLIDEAELLKQKKIASDDQAFVSWKYETERWIQKQYGNNSKEEKKFNSILFSPIVFAVGKDNAANKINECKKGLETAISYLKIYLEEIENESDLDNVEYDNKQLPTIFISYNQESASDFVEFLKKSLLHLANLTIDKSSLKYGESISGFMKKIRKHDFIIVVVTDEYLKSLNCMTEVINLMKDDDWKEHTLFIVYAVNKVYTLEGRAEYERYWHEKKETDKEKYATGMLSHDYVDVMQIENDICNYISDFLKEIADKNNPQIYEAKDYIINKISTT